jgi:hypothetical protein
MLHPSMDILVISKSTMEAAFELTHLTDEIPVVFIIAG